ncbi:MAG TPA: hypothetical protein VMV72_08035 [Verrucomicrobiae bacterium]|nr:hypothetical protein [Verrucomicrobiae bacterium]
MLGFVDSITAAYVAWGAISGRRRRLSVEIPRLTSVTLALFSGTGLLHWIERVVGEFNKITGQITGILGWGGGVLGSFYLVRSFRERLRQWIAKRWADETLQKRGGMVAGFLRTLFVSGTIVLFLLHTHFAFVVRDSAMGRSLASIVTPVYHNGSTTPR